MLTRKNFGKAVAVAGIAALGVAGCSSDPTPSPTASSPTASPTSASPTASPTHTSDVTRYELNSSGGEIKLAGQGGASWKVTGGSMRTSANDSGGLLITVAASGGSLAGEIDIRLQTNSDNEVLSGSIVGNNRDFEVTGPGGSINFLSTADGTTLVTVDAIPVQEGTETPTTLTFSLPASR